ncbi:MAG TPA: EAL domain-containing protein, partial [Candidatus Saccharimonadales bacterium]|nr:EAL domain-containing protein [Candidatus Saccharimonadales bacterium]
AVRGLGHDARLAVDDAGAGVANFGHIIELRPDFVKLDISLVRGVNANLGRQAMVVGMRHFSRTAGCRLIAEGVETEEEARTLTGLGVEFGQGYLFGRPEPVGAWVAATADGGNAGHPTPTVPGDEAHDHR